MSRLSISYDDVVRAHQRIATMVHNTPVLTSSTFDRRQQASFFFKCENFQRTGAFKLRGASNAIALLTPEQRGRAVVAFSGGNHAQGIAYSAKSLSMRAVIVMPGDAPASKVAATRDYGAEVILFDRHTQDREAIARHLSEDRGLTLIPSYDDPAVMAGQGTAAIELFNAVGELDVLLVPLGGGGLLSGCATVAKALYPACAVIGVEPEAGNDGQQSLMRGEIVHIPIPQTIADGAQAQHLGEHTFPVIREYVDAIVTVADAELIAAMRFFANYMKMLVEPTACLAAAAAAAGRLDLKGKRVGVLVTGGNVDVGRFCALTQAGK